MKDQLTAQNSKSKIENRKSQIPATPEPPYYAVIFTSVRTDVDDNYDDMAARMVELASEQDGFLGIEHARDNIGITISYWRDEESIRRWKDHAEHRIAQRNGYEKWYSSFATRVCKVERQNLKL